MMLLRTHLRKAHAHGPLCKDPQHGTGYPVARPAVEWTRTSAHKAVQRTNARACQKACTVRTLQALRCAEVGCGDGARQHDVKSTLVGVVDFAFLPHAGHLCVWRAVRQANVQFGGSRCECVSFSRPPAPNRAQ